MKLESPPKTGNPALDVWLEKLTYMLESGSHLSTGWTVTNKTEDKTLDCSLADNLTWSNIEATIAILADVLGTLIDDLKD